MPSKKGSAEKGGGKSKSKGGPAENGGGKSKKGGKCSDTEPLPTPAAAAGEPLCFKRSVLASERVVVSSQWSV